MEWKKVFVTQTSKGPLGRLQELCDKEGIQLIEINEVIKRLVSELGKKYPKDGKEVGEEEGIARFLIHVIQNDFLGMKSGKESGSFPSPNKRSTVPIEPTACKKSPRSTQSHRGGECKI
jgi:hypothetical protein